MKNSCSVIVPAFNEAERIGETLRAILHAQLADELIVVDDGSQDDTRSIARRWTNQVYCHPCNRGKGEALQTGYSQAKGDVLLFLDADLGETAGLAAPLLQPILQRQADMTVAVLPPAVRKGGLGLAKRVARHGVFRFSGYVPSAPLSGQRALRREVLEGWVKFPGGFGFEVGLTIRAVRMGYKVLEVPVAFRHRETGRDLQGYCHRARELLHVLRVLKAGKDL